MKMQPKFFRKPTRNKYGAKKTVVGDLQPQASWDYGAVPPGIQPVRVHGAG